MQSEQELVALKNLAKAEKALVEIGLLLSKHRVNTREGVELTNEFADKLLQQEKTLRQAISKVMKSILND